MTADVVVLGGGVVGASVAYHLARSGAGRVTVVDRGGGSTERATGGFRAQFATEINVRLSLLSLSKLLRFAEETGVDPGYAPHGYLFVASTEQQLVRLRAARAVQAAAGHTETRELGAAEVLALNPALSSDGIRGGSFSASDGFLRPTEIQRGYREAAGRLGVRFLTGSVQGLRRAGARILAVETAGEALPCGEVVNAAGAWAGEVARLAGGEVPVTPLRRQLAVSEPTSALPASMPMTIFPDGFHLRVRDGRVLLLQPSPPAPDPFDVSVDPRWVDSVLATARERLPCLRSLGIASAHAGLYEMTPDEHALLGPAPFAENLFLVAGSSGHGVMHAPALGQLAAEMLVGGGARALDVSALDPNRFAEGRPNRGAPLL
ncbi:MAG TPA: FAD-binding oxidoreductase [Myxococcaceae bacterium]|nr:FAD-binding oxidoreductase [Myxococcaceae bacterium]